MSNEKITCAICNAQTHIMKRHLEEAHAGITVESYQANHPGHPVLSAMAIAALEKKRKETAEAKAAADNKETVVAMAGSAVSKEEGASVTTLIPKGSLVKKALHEVFSLGASNKEAMNKRGDPIPITVITAHDQQDMVPPISADYVYNPDELKDLILAIEMNVPAYIWGHKGSGKSELWEQVCACTNRPTIRVQHTVNTEESHITGQWTVKGGETVFELGPLPLAMINGWVYVADEYDFAMPSVIAVYQAVLEGKALVIKEAPAEMRIIKPHPNFRIGATGNTNGSGDETGLYQGTLIQNSANYDRFGMVINKQYMNKKAESLILQKRCALNVADADKMVDFATQVRESFAAGRMSDTVSPRTLIYACKIGVLRGSFRHGLNRSFTSKLCKVDREVAEGLAQRVFGAV